jgi:HK97 family phage prohead protease
MQNKREYRATGTASVDGNTLTGYIARFNELSEDLGGFQEKLAPGCFASSLGKDIRALINHDTSSVVGRTSVGTLKLSEDAQGLAFSIDLPNTQAARDLKVSVERGDLSGCSFGFVCTKDAWAGNIRTVLDTQLFEVSVGVTFPAYESTTMALRALFPDGAVIPPFACACSCAQCQAGSCGICSNGDCKDSACGNGGCTNQVDEDDDDADGDDLGGQDEFNALKREDWLIRTRFRLAQLRATA